MTDAATTLEQWARDILELAIKERLVRLPKAGEWGGSQHPQARSAGELMVVANKLNELLNVDRQRQQARAQAAKAVAPE